MQMRPESTVPSPWAGRRQNHLRPETALVDELAALYEQQRELRSQLQDVTLAIAEHEAAVVAAASLVEGGAIGGTQFVARVERKSEWRFPRKTEEPVEYARLDTALRGSGHWPKCSSIDRWALRRLWGTPTSPPELRSLLRSAGKEIVKPVVHLLLRD